ncbi:cholecystokinin precursor [Cynoglossus semilaevis]|uniref:CC chemokine n=1 Tax=Cynoglossus semilaevis TaxID=244447 RepID=G1CCF0_CYNSE|nr:cholecystokinin precursor [Cynoglossus semilaevis]AEL31667.1 CC chemokine [Cynoglossus semilaevis]
MSVTVKIFICCCFIVMFSCCCILCQPQMVIDCCLSVKNKTITKHIITDYHQQSAGQGCSIEATILVTRRNKKLCVPADEPWVHMVMSHVDKMKKPCHGKRRNKRCVKVKKM